MDSHLVAFGILLHDLQVFHPSLRYLSVSGSWWNLGTPSLPQYFRIALKSFSSLRFPVSLQLAVRTGSLLGGTMPSLRLSSSYSSALVVLTYSKPQTHIIMFCLRKSILKTSLYILKMSLHLSKMSIFLFHSSP